MNERTNTCEESIYSLLANYTVQKQNLLVALQKSCIEIFL